MEDFKFGFVTFGEIDKAAETHPAVYRSFVTEDGDFTEFEPFRGNPDIYEEFPFFFYIAHEDRVVCNRFAIPDVLITDRGKHPWSWGGGFFTVPEYRGKGLGTKLIDNMVRVLHGKGIGSGMVFSTPVSVHIYRKLGYSFMGYADRFVFLRSCAPLLRKYIDCSGVIKFADTLFRPFPRALVSILSSLGPGRNKDLSRHRIDKAEVESTMEGLNIHHGSRFRFNDSGAKLAFKLSRAGNSQFFIMEDKKENRPAAYFILKNRVLTQPLGGYSGFRMMSLMDYGFFSQNPLSPKLLVREVFDSFMKSDAEVLDIVSSHPGLSSAAGRMGMINIGKGMSFTFTFPDSWNLNTENSGLEDWQLSHFSGDGYSFE